MGTTAEKLKYLNETKAEIKNALETPYNVMRDYPELIKKYIDNQPTKVVTDGICGNAVDVPVKAIETNGNIRQETTEGYNLLNVPEVLEISIFKEIEVNLEANNTYTFKFDNAIAGSDNNISRIAFRSTTDVVVKNLNTSTVKNFEIQPTQDITNIRIYSSTDYSSSVGKTKTFQKLMIYEGTEDKPYEPYTGGIPSPSPDYPQEITSVGGYDNLFDKNNIINGSYVSDGNGAFVSNSTSKRTDYIEIQANSYYYIYSDKTSGNWGAWYDKDKKFISGITLGGQKEGVVNSPANAIYFAFTISYQGNLTDYSKIKINETAIKIKQSGKNLYNQENFLNANNWIKNTDSYYTGAANDLHIYINNNKNYIVSNFKENTQYSISLKGYSDSIGGNFRFVFKYTDGTSSMNYILNTITESDYRVISQQGKTISYITTDYSSSRTLYIKDFMLKEVNIGNEYYEPYHESIITPINLQGNILSKVGNVKDILKINRNGEVEIKKNTWEETINTSSLITLSNNNKGLAFTTSKKKITSMSDNDYLVTNAQRNRTFNDGTVYQNPANFVFVGSPTDTLETIKAKFNGGKILYQLATPQIITLPSISPIELWQGTNIFSLVTNLDTDFEVEYVVDKDSVTKEEE